MNCPTCGLLAIEGARFCSHCGAALTATAPASTPSASRDEVDRAAAMRIPLPATAKADGAFCGECGLQNFAGREFCVKCGTALNGRSPSPPPMSQPAPRMFEPVERTEPVPKVVAPAPKRARSRAALLVGVGVVVLTAIWAGVLVAGGDKTPEDTAATGGSTPAPGLTSTAAPAPVRVEPATITASASSTLPDEGQYTYGIRNTLDGKPDTAWNDGAPGSGAGEKLTYRFATPLRLTSISLINGYASNPELFKQNARLRNVVIVTETGRFPLTLGDVLDRQSFDAAFGRTSTVVIEVVSVYPGSKYDDLALSEIEFYAMPA